MPAKILLACVLFAFPALANPRLFDIIRVNQSVTIALPNAQCDAKVVSRNRDQLTLQLKKTTPCGPRKSTVTLARIDLDNVIDERPQGRRVNGSISPAGSCTIGGIVLVATSAGQYLGETSGDGAALAVIAAGGVISAALCHGIFFPQPPRFTVFASKLTPSPPKVP